MFRKNHNIIIITILLFSILSNSCYDNKIAHSEENRNDKSQGIVSDSPMYMPNITSHQLPDTLTFCDEIFDLTDPTIKERVEREFYLLLQQPGQLVLYLKRSGRYFPMYEEKLNSAGLPTDLKYLSVAESALYMSRSKAGAMGLWQFMKGTAKRYGLRVNKYVDERKHPEKSTDAALKYLKKAYDDFGTWTMAAAAYNMGGAGLNKNRKYQTTDNYFDLYLNSETSRYLFRIATIKYMLENKEKFGINLSDDDYYKPYNTEIRTVNSGIKNLSKWAKQVGTNYKILKLYNPWLINNTLNSPGRGNLWHIALPKGNERDDK